MRTSEEIALQEKINELRAKQRKYSNWETEATKEAERLFVKQTEIENELVALESKQAALKSKRKRESLLGGIL